MQILVTLGLLFALVCASFAAPFDDFRYFQLPVRRGFPEPDYVKSVPSFSNNSIVFRRLMPKERRAPAADFDDMSSFMRSLDGIQKPRYVTLLSKIQLLSDSVEADE